MMFPWTSFWIAGEPNFSIIGVAKINKIKQELLLFLQVRTALVAKIRSLPIYYELDDSGVTSYTCLQLIRNCLFPPPKRK